MPAPKSAFAPALPTPIALINRNSAMSRYAELSATLQMIAIRLTNVSKMRMPPSQTQGFAKTSNPIGVSWPMGQNLQSPAPRIDSDVVVEPTRLFEITNFLTHS